jgi:hypothetical protein
MAGNFRLVMDSGLSDDGDLSLVEGYAQGFSGRIFDDNTANYTNQTLPVLFGPL